MKTDTIIKFCALAILAATLTGCGAASHPRRDAGFGRVDAPRGQIGHACAAGTLPFRPRLLLDHGRCM